MTAVAKVEGDASVGVIRGRTRHIFDLELEVRWEARGEGRAAGHSAALPEELLCPILLTVLVDPVSTADGQCYERAAIER